MDAWTRAQLRVLIQIAHAYGVDAVPVQALNELLGDTVPEPQSLHVDRIAAVQEWTG